MRFWASISQVTEKVDLKTRRIKKKVKVLFYY